MSSKSRKQPLRREESDDEDDFDFEEESSEEGDNKTNKPELKKGKFSVIESKIVQDAIRQYCAEQGLELSTLSPYYRPEGKKRDKNLHRSLWDGLMLKLTNRSRMAIYQHGMRWILNHDVITGPFSEEEKSKLLQLVSTISLSLSLSPGLSLSLWVFSIFK
jgi:hypothetical protein